MNRLFRSLVPVLVAGLAGVLPACARTPDPASSGASAPEPQPATAPGPAESLQIPDVALLDQDGKSVRLASDVIGRRIVAVNFAFTECTTACPLLGAKFGEVQQLLGSELGGTFGLVTISVDPGTDTPARLKAFAGRFGGGPGWRLLTGPKPVVDSALRAFGAFTPDKQSHPSSVVILDGTTGQARRINGVASAEQIATALRSAAAERTAAAPPAAPMNAEGKAARAYFTDTELIDQNGRRLRLYSDIMHQKVVVIHTFFASCTGSCVRLTGALKGFQERYGDRLGKDLHLVSISVDPDADRPEVLREYAARVGAKPGWFLLTGTRANVDLVLQKLGQKVAAKEDHSSLLLIGNDRTGLWKKVMGLGEPATLFPSLDGVLNDRPVRDE